MRLWSQVTGSWQSTDYTYKASGTQTAMTSPTPGSTLPGSSATFTWTVETGVTNAGLWVGTTLGGSDLYYGSASAGPITTATVPGLPVNGSSIYVRLWSQVAGSWQSTDYTYKASGTQTAMTSPTPGSTLPGSSATFTWTVGTGVTNAGLWVGTTSGGSDLYFGSAIRWPGYDSDGFRPARKWQHHLCATMVASRRQLAVHRLHVQSQRHPDSDDQPYAGNDVVRFLGHLHLDCGNGGDERRIVGRHDLGGSDLYYGSASAGPITTATVPSLPVNGSTVYVRLWSQVNGTWQYTDYMYESAGPITATTSGTVGGIGVPSGVSITSDNATLLVASFDSCTFGVDPKIETSS